MKKRILATVAAIMLAATTTIAAAYPNSPDWEHPLPTDGTILTGELIGTPSWNNTEATTFEKAWDGDESTFYDPAEKGEHCYTGVKLDKAYILTEIRIMPRSDQLPRFIGASIQGSNDGENWTSVLINVDEATAGQDYYRFAPDTFEAGSNTGYSYYRYVNNNDHGDVSEVELYGNPVDGAVAETPAVVEETPAVEEAPVVEEAETVDVAPAEEAPAAETTAPPTNDSFALIASLLALTIVSTYVVMRKRIER